MVDTHDRIFSLKGLLIGIRAIRSIRIRKERIDFDWGICLLSGSKGTVKVYFT